MTQTDLFGWTKDDPVEGDSKVCSKCGTDKPLAAYSFHSGGSYLRTECKSCTNHMTRIRKDIRSRHGMPSVGYCCPICLRTSEEVAGSGGKSAGSWVVDHCHTSDKFRGWLCHKCNRTLGGFEDDISMMHRAIAYLKA
jgi:hypothetical protein